MSSTTSLISSSTSNNLSKSGIITSSSGERHIPSSLRSDGSKRREIKIRPGYKPPEDVEIYKNRTAEAFNTRGSRGIPGAADLESEIVDGDAKATNKNAKRREARKKAKAAEENREGEENGELKEEDGVAQVNHSKITKSLTENPTEKNWRSLATTSASTPEAEPDPELEKEKQARNLKKKLRQARELREKKDKGESLLPEQFEKVIKINELIRQLDSLGFDAEGQSK